MVCATPILVMGQFSVHNSVINDYYKVNTVSQWEKIMITRQGFANIVEPGLLYPLNPIL